MRVATNLTGGQKEKLAAKLRPCAATNNFNDADAIVLEPRQGHDLKATEIAAITDRVRQGATLLVTLGPWPQLTSMQLGEVLPAVTWQASGASGSNGHIPRGPVECGWFDKDFFASPLPAGTVLPFFVTVEPMTSMQRGQARYAQYQKKIRCCSKWCSRDASYGPGPCFYATCISGCAVRTMRRRRSWLRGVTEPDGQLCSAADLSSLSVQVC